MSGFAADVIGLIGSALFLAAFAYANFSPTFDKLWFNAVNLRGSALLLTSLAVHFNLAATVLETCWGLIAAAGLIGAIRKRRQPA
ncbi:MAG: hypothetical protein NVSMB69_16060 [Novosphingobium sp.]